MTGREAVIAYSVQVNFNVETLQQGKSSTTSIERI
jgi:hypothetical protein